ncbi:MAG TPA: ATP-binding protein [Candidatus Saccharimonadales bacterium]|nr:ATP-binding protein [Candidatus Saccharimonadales bacterium]
MALFSRRKSADANQTQGIETGFILDTIEDGVVMITADGRIHLFNPAAGRISGWPPQEAVGLDYRNVLRLVDAQGQAAADSANPFARTLAVGQTVRDNDSSLIGKDGRATPVSVIVSPILEPQGQPTGDIVAVIRDMAKQKEEEAQRSDFISTASHEMRTPLAAIEGYLSLALNPKTGQVDDRTRNYLEKAASSTKHLGELFRDLLTSSKAEDGRLISYPAVIEVGEMLTQVAEAARFPAKAKGLELTFSVSAGDKKAVRPLYYAYVDPNRIREVFQNLIDNAIKYTPSGSITLRLTGDANVIQVQIQDTGTGIPAEDIPHLFQKFYRVDSSTTRTVGGSGLGLFICKKIIELYNGRIWVESQLGKGSTFFINLPRLNSQQALEIQRRQSATITPLTPV